MAQNLNNNSEQSSNGDLSQYFESFTPNLMEKIRLDEFIGNLPKTNPYFVPQGYFEQFKVNTKTSFLSISYKKVAVLAASILLLIALSYTFLFNKPNTENNFAQNTTYDFNSITADEATKYVLENIDDFELEDLQPEVVASNLKGTQINIDELSTEEIETYLEEAL